MAAKIRGKIRDPDFARPVAAPVSGSRAFSSSAALKAAKVGSIRLAPRRLRRGGKDVLEVALRGLELVDRAEPERHGDEGLDHSARTDTRAQRGRQLFHPVPLADGALIEGACARRIRMTERVRPLVALDRVAIALERLEGHGAFV